MEGIGSGLELIMQHSVIEKFIKKNFFSKKCYLDSFNLSPSINIYIYRFIVCFLIGLPSPCVLMESIVAEVLQPDALSGVNHRRGVYY